MNKICAAAFHLLQLGVKLPLKGEECHDPEGIQEGVSSA
jgi:hypothetical protein